MENDIKNYSGSVKDIRETTERDVVSKGRLCENTEFRPTYKELGADFNPNPFSASSCRCKPGRC